MRGTSGDCYFVVTSLWWSFFVSKCMLPSNLCSDFFCQIGNGLNRSLPSTYSVNKIRNFWAKNFVAKSKYSMRISDFESSEVRRWSHGKCITTKEHRIPEWLSMQFNSNDTHISHCGRLFRCALIVVLFNNELHLTPETFCIIYGGSSMEKTRNNEVNSRSKSEEKERKRVAKHPGDFSLCKFIELMTINRNYPCLRCWAFSAHLLNTHEHEYWNFSFVPRSRKPNARCYDIYGIFNNFLWFFISFFSFIQTRPIAAATSKLCLVIIIIRFFRWVECACYRMRALENDFDKNK